jgi:hypothetical protein
MEKRIIGHRRPRDVGEPGPPTHQEQAWLSYFASRRTCVPKGVFRYRTHEEANADWDRWNAELVAETLVRKSWGTEGEAPSDSLFTRPATWSDVLELARLLERHQVRYVLVGGYALAAHGYVRMTQDIDIAVAPTPENSVRWIAALSHLPDHAAADMAGEEDPFQGDYLHAIRINDEFTVDVLPSVAGVSFEELEAHAVTIEAPGGSLRVLNLEGLLLTKQGIRPKDIADREILIQALNRIQSK